MPVNSLLELNTDKLFEEHSVSEIQETQKRIQAEIDRKREELRTMVGERYRDLIEAADTIGDMKATAEGIISHVENMTQKVQQLMQQNLLGFPASNRPCVRSSRKSIYYSVAVQIKILMDIPEHIWTSIDKEDYVLGAQLYLFARHINTGLHLQSVGEGEISAQQLSQWFPVLIHQWSTICHFYDTILLGCEEKIQKQDVTSDEVSNCLCAFALLERLSSEDLLNRFLDLRTRALKNTLKSDVHRSVKSRILDSVKLLVHTFSLLQACFVESSAPSKGELIYLRLKEIVEETAQPSISLVDLSDTIGKKWLPAVILDFRPSLSKSMDPLPQSSVRDSVSRWLESIHEFVLGEVVTLLELVGSLRGLAAVRGAKSTIQPSHIVVCQSLLNQGADLWTTFFKPPLTSRAHKLIEGQWAVASHKLQEAVASATSDISGSRSLQPEHDLRWFVWREWGSDLPQGGQQERNSRGLLMKAKGYSPRIEKLCKEFDDQLQALLHDLQHYIGDSVDDGPNFIRNEEASSEQADKIDLQEYLKKCSVHHIKTLVSYLQQEHADSSQGCLLFLARLLQALCDLCPHLQQCLTTPNSRIVLLSSDSSQETTSWQEVCSLLRQESLLLWSRWRTCMSAKVNKLVAATLIGPTDLRTTFPILPRWDVVSIEEEGEEGHRIRSNIKLPSQPSLPLQTLLNTICCEINGAAPHTLPRKIHQELAEDIIGNIFDSYKTATKKKSLSQALALQYFLDVKYLTLLLVPRDNKFLMGSSQEICEKLENEIDPFDFDVFCPYIQNNIKKSVQRTQGLLGVLIAWPEKLCHVPQSRSAGTGSGSGTVSSVDDPSVLAVGQASPWFPLLPVTGHAGGNRQAVLPTAAARETEKPLQKKVLTPKPKSDPSPGEIVRSGAAAFFGAMSTDWFG